MEQDDQFEAIWNLKELSRKYQGIRNINKPTISERGAQEMDKVIILTLTAREVNGTFPEQNHAGKWGEGESV